MVKLRKWPGVQDLGSLSVLGSERSRTLIALPQPPHWQGWDKTSSRKKFLLREISD